jgi:hypothetical protein
LQDREVKEGEKGETFFGHQVLHHQGRVLLLYDNVKVEESLLGHFNQLFLDLSSFLQDSVIDFHFLFVTANLDLEFFDPGLSPIYVCLESLLVRPPELRASPLYLDRSRYHLAYGHVLLIPSGYRTHDYAGVIPLLSREPL